MTMAAIQPTETPPYHVGDRLEVLVRRADNLAYWPAVVVEEPAYLPNAPFGRHWRLVIEITAPTGSKIPGLLAVDYNGGGYDLPGVPATRAAEPEE